MGPYGLRLCCCALAAGQFAAFAQDSVHLTKFNDWSRIEALTPGAVTHVRIHKREAPKGSRNIKGFFSSSTDTAITLLFRDGSTRSIERGLVSSVRVRIPMKKRYVGWAIGIATAAITGYMWGQPHSDYTVAAAILMPALFTFPATVLGLQIMPTRLVYRASANP